MFLIHCGFSEIKVGQKCVHEIKRKSEYGGDYFSASVKFIEKSESRNKKISTLYQNAKDKPKPSNVFQHEFISKLQTIDKFD